MTNSDPTLLPWMMGEPNPFHASGKRKPLARVLESRCCSEWLHAMVHYAHESGSNAHLHQLLITELTDDELNILYGMFAKPDYVALINSIFFYKQDPQSLYEQILHPEKMVSVQSRLNFLHEFIEYIYKSTVQTLGQRGQAVYKDYLLHGQDTPPGVSIENAADFRDSIVSAIKEWRLKGLISQDDLSENDGVACLFGAYKFWFNPEQLIDTVMMLRLAKQDNQHIFSSLDTSQCLDLYGYFSNKSSGYLMRTLLAAYDGQIISGLPAFSSYEKKAIRTVYHTLDSLMNALRDELQHRQIITEPYDRTIDAHLKPGNRIIRAIHRIIYLYMEEQERNNLLLEGLFRELSRFHQH